MKHIAWSIFQYIMFLSSVTFYNIFNQSTVLTFWTCHVFSTQNSLIYLLSVTSLTYRSRALEYGGIVQDLHGCTSGVCHVGVRTHGNLHAVW